MAEKLSRPVIILERSSRGLNVRELGVLTAKASRAAGLRGAVNVLITGSGKIRQLNLRFRGKRQVTDVLSFPSSISNGCAGDIAICLSVAVRNARMLGHSVSDEVQILILHGILHLAGYDHENDRGEMKKKEISLRRRLGLPLGLIERTQGQSSLAVDRSSFAKPRNGRRSGQQPSTNFQRRSRT